MENGERRKQTNREIRGERKTANNLTRSIERYGTSCISGLRRSGWACFAYTPEFKRIFCSIAKNCKDDQENLKYLIAHRCNIRVCLFDDKIYYSVTKISSDNKNKLLKFFFEAETLNIMPKLFLKYVMESSKPIEIMDTTYYNCYIFEH